MEYVAAAIKITLAINTCLVFLKSNKNPIGIENKAAKTLPADIAPENNVLENPKSADIGTINIDRFKLPEALDTN